MNRARLVSAITGFLRELVEHEESTPFGEDTPLFGARGLLDSLGVVNLVADVETWVSDEVAQNLTLADARAMSEERSPFRTVGSLTDYVVARLSEASP